MLHLHIHIKRSHLILLILALAILFGIRLASAWTNPTQAPPNGNVSLPSAQWTASGTAIYNSNSGNVGIGLTNPGQKFSVSGTIESTSGGFKFPDGTVQKAGAGGSFVRGVVGATASVATYTFSSADMVQFWNPTASAVDKIATNVGSLTNNIGTASARNGRDQAGAFSANSWVYLYYTWDGSTVATRSSASAPPTGPTLGNGETSWAFIGAYRLDGSTNFINTYTRGNNVTYKTAQVVLSGGNNASFTSVSLSAVVPPQATAPIWSGIIGNAAAGTNNAGINLSLDGTASWFSGYPYIWATPVAGSVEWRTLISEIPNISQTIYYAKVDGTASIGIDVMGYRVANGG